MKVQSTRIQGAHLIELERIEDARGFFARSWCREEFHKAGLNAELAQCSVSYNHLAGTLRGLHYQADPHGETKLVRCTRGRIFDVLVDLREGSTSFGQWQAFELNESNHTALYIPPGIAHGFQTLVDGTEVFYQMSDPYVPDAARTVYWNDARFSIPWPIPRPILSEKDRGNSA